jgi:hypothetical protein
VDVDSKRAAHHKGNLELCEFFQVYWEDALRSRIKVQADGMAEKFGVEGANAHAERDTAEMAFGEPEKDSSDRTDLVVLYALGAGHGTTSHVNDVEVLKGVMWNCGGDEEAGS